MRLKVGIDIRDLKTATTGQKTYLEELCTALTRKSSADLQFVFLDTKIPIIKGNSAFTKIAEQINLHFWKQCVLPIKALYHKCDILFCTDYFVPFFRLGFKTAVVFHDAFFFEHKEHYHPIFIQLFKHLALPSAKRSSYIITPSLYSKHRISRFYPTLPVEKIFVIPEGPKTFTATTANKDECAITLRKIGNEQKPYFLHVGVMNKRKNIPFLLKAFAQLLKLGYDYQLVLAGPLNTSKYISDEQVILSTIEALDLGDRVKLTGYLSTTELSYVYQHARIYVFPSIDEGFGLPLLEAFKFGLPALIANNTCLPEVGGDAVLSFDPFNENDLTEKMIQLIENNDLRLELSNKGMNRLKDFSWDKTADQLISLFRSK